VNLPRAPRPFRVRGDRPDGRSDATAGIAFSGLLIAVSFVALIIPLAVFHAAQVAAALRLRTAVLLLCGVVGVCLLLGVLAGLDAFLMGGLVGLLWTPLLSVALYERARARSKVLSLALFFLPVLLLLGFTVRAPIVPNLAVLAEERVEQALRDAKPLLQGTQTAPESPSAPLSGEQAVTPPPTDFATTARAGLEALKGSREFAILSDAAALSPWQRLLWLVFGEGSHVLFLLLGITLGNLFFLDVAFAQVERVRAAARYVNARSAQFPPALAASLARLRFVAQEGLPLSPEESPGGAPAAASEVARLLPENEVIVAHHKERDGERPFAQTGANGTAVPLWKRLFARRLERGRVRMWGYVFEFAEGPAARGWELKYFSLPLPVALVAVGVLAGLGAVGGDAQGVYAAFASAPTLPWAGLAAVVSFLVLTVVAFQGAVAVYMRLPPLLLLVCLFVLFIVGTTGVLTPLVILAALGGFGLLDYAYDFRGRLPSSVPRPPSVPRPFS
jgi:hypothetical protein